MPLIVKTAIVQYRQVMQILAILWMSVLCTINASPLMLFHLFVEAEAEGWELLVQLHARSVRTHEGEGMHESFISLSLHLLVKVNENLCTANLCFHFKCIILTEDWHFLYSLFRPSFSRINPLCHIPHNSHISSCCTTESTRSMYTHLCQTGWYLCGEMQSTTSVSGSPQFWCLQ